MRGEVSTIRRTRVPGRLNKNTPGIPADIVVFHGGFLSDAMRDESDSRSRLDAVELPTNMADILGEVRPTSDQPSTLADVVDPAGEWLPPGRSLSLSAMYQDEDTRHAVHLEDSVEHVPCILDALIVSLVTPDDPVRIESTSPVDDAVVEYRISDDVVDVAPEGAVISFGIAPEDANGIQYGDDFEDDARIGSCSYINSFADERTYEQWADETDAAAVMKLSVDAAAAVARRLATSELFETER